MNGTHNIKMKKKTTKKKSLISKKKDLIGELSKFFRSQLYLDKWMIHISYPKTDKKSGEYGCVFADITTQEKYYEIDINIYPSLLKQDSTIVFLTMLHELCHVLTEKQQELARKPLDGEFSSKELLETANEQETSALQVIIGSLMYRGPEVNKDYKELMTKLSKVFK